MALADLHNELEKDSFSVDDYTEKGLVSMVLRLLQDANGEVQNEAVKCLELLVKRARYASISHIADCLCRLAAEATCEGIRDIATVALKATIKAVAQSDNAVQGDAFSARLITKWQSRLKSNLATDDAALDAITNNGLETITEVLQTFGLAAHKNAALMGELGELLFSQTVHTRGPIRKRASACLLGLLHCVSKSQYDAAMIGLQNRRHDRHTIRRWSDKDSAAAGSIPLSARSKQV